jgi:hypothetical protein
MKLLINVLDEFMDVTGTETEQVNENWRELLDSAIFPFLSHYIFLGII